MAKPGKKEGTFPTPDGTKLYYCTVQPANPKGIVVIIHGLGEYCGRYRDFTDYLVKHGWGVYLFDQRGHGKSPGTRMFARDLNQLVEDLGDFLRYVRKQNPKKKLFLFGHSFGGQVSINYLAGEGNSVQGLILSAPNVRVAVHVSSLKRLVARLLVNLIPTLRLPTAIKPEFISHDAAVVEQFRSDKLIQHKITLRLGTALIDNVEGIMKLAPEIRMPCLILHGEKDQVTSPEGSKELFKVIGSKDRDLKLYPGFFHEILNEVGKEKVYRDIEEWLEKRL